MYMYFFLAIFRFYYRAIVSNSIPAPIHSFAIRIFASVWALGYGDYRIVSMRRPPCIIMHDVRTDVILNQSGLSINSTRFYPPMLFITTKPFKTKNSNTQPTSSLLPYSIDSFQRHVCKGATVCFYHFL